MNNVMKIFGDWRARVSRADEEKKARRAKAWEDLLIPKVDFVDPQMVAEFLGRNTEYRADRALRGRWQTPEETWLAGVGDCEDLAALFSAIATANSIPHTVNAMFTPRQREGHIYVAGQFDRLGSYWAVSNNQFFKVLPSCRPEDVVARQIGWTRPYHIMTLWPETVTRLTVGKEVTA